MNILQSARVLGVMGRSAFLLVNGKAVKVPNSSGSLREGQLLQGTLTEKNGKSFFQSQGSTSVQMSKGQQVLGDFFRNNGIPMNERNLLVGYKLMEMGKPLSPAVFSQLSRYVSILPDISENSIQALLVSLYSGFPLRPGILSALKAFFDKGGSFKKWMKGVERDPALKNGSKYIAELHSITGGILKSFVQRGGYNNEALLLKFARYFSNLPEDLGDEFKKLLKEYSSSLKLANSADSQQYVFSVPYLVDGQLDEMYFRYYKKKQQGADSESFHLDVFLELTNLGRLRLGFFTIDGKLLINAGVESKEVESFLEQCSPDLEKLLYSLGKYTQVKFTVGCEKVEYPALLESAPREPVSLDVKI